MYAFVDRPIDGLCGGARFLLWSMRGWAHMVGQRGFPPGVLAPSFSSTGLLDMLPAFHAVMALLHRDGLGTVALAPISYPVIVEDEAVLLAMWRDAALGQKDRIARTLPLLVREEGVPFLAAALADGVIGLKAAGLDPSTPSDDILRVSRD